MFRLARLRHISDLPQATVLSWPSRPSIRRRLLWPSLEQDRTAKQPIYPDYNATTPVDPAVVEAMLPYLRTHFGNPSSDHAYGTQAHAAVETARSQVAALLGVATDGTFLRATAARPTTWPSRGWPILGVSMVITSSRAPSNTRPCCNRCASSRGRASGSRSCHRPHADRKGRSGARIEAG